MTSFRTILALGVLAASSAAQAAHFAPIPPPPAGCKGPIAQLFWDLGNKNACRHAVSVPEPATLGLLGIGLIGLAVKRRRK